jgi:hypothetical protein
MRFIRPFCGITLLAAVLLAPASILPARVPAAQAAQQPMPSEGARSDSSRASAVQTTGMGNLAAAVQASPPPPTSLTGRAIEKAKGVAKSAGDIFSRVPCLPPKGGAKSIGSLPHVAGKLASGLPVVIVAFGSSSTEGYGSTAPEFTYPNRLATQLRRQYPN